MARPRPFLLCRYNLLVDQRPLSAHAQLTALKELQGQYVAVTAAAERAKRRDSAIFRPRTMTVEGESAITWSVGRRLGMRVTVEPDKAGGVLELKAIPDTGVHYSDFVVIPRLSVLAVDDRSGEPHLGGKAAINRFQAIFEHLDGGEAVIELTATKGDVQKALSTWGLTEFSFVVRPYNPHPAGDLSKVLSDDFRKDGIGRGRGIFRPALGERMKPSENGPIAAVRELADDGYGQYAFKGVTEDGHVAQIKAPQFDPDKEKNQRNQAQPRELRIVIDVGEDSDEQVLRHVVVALRKFYG